jgi:hypothetical protein
MDIPTQVANFDICAISDRVARVAMEVFYSASASNGSVYLEADLNRTRSYMDLLQATLDRIKATPMDLPKSHGILYSLLMTFPSDEDIVGVENQYVKEVLRRLQALWHEVTMSQSADQQSGINDFDYARASTVVDSVMAALNDATVAYDFPENVGNVPVPGGTASGTRSARRTISGSRPLR